jgi:hypothetical protein
LRAKILALLLALAVSEPLTAGDKKRVVAPPTTKPPSARRRAVTLPPSFKQNVLTITNRVFVQYPPSTDLSALWQHMRENPEDGGNPNYAVIPLVRAAALIQKYENGGKPEDVDAALENLERVLALYPTWKTRWLSPAPATFLAIHIYMLRQEPGLNFVQINRVAIAWNSVLFVVENEANFWLAQTLPLTPWDSATTGDTKAEEDAWLAGIFAAAEVFLPELPNTPLYAKRARQLAYDSITRPSDPPDSEGIKTITISEDFTLLNHGKESPYYTGATPMLLQLGALPYLMTGREIPEEFYHNVDGLFAKYKSYIVVDANGNMLWNLPGIIDPGNPTDFPLGMAEDELEQKFAAEKVHSGYLWVRTVRVDVPMPPVGPMVWQCIQDHKVAWYYTVGSYDWHWPKN